MKATLTRKQLNAENKSDIKNSDDLIATAIICDCDLASLATVLNVYQSANDYGCSLKIKSSDILVLGTGRGKTQSAAIIKTLRTVGIVFDQPFGAGSNSRQLVSIETLLDSIAKALEIKRALIVKTGAKPIYDL
jgi:hypothetical protein